MNILIPANRVSLIRKYLEGGHYPKLKKIVFDETGSKPGEFLYNFIKTGPVDPIHQEQKFVSFHNLDTDELFFSTRQERNLERKRKKAQYP